MVTHDEQMANKTILMIKIRQILLHHAQGIGSKQITRLTGIAWNTDKCYIRQFTLEEMTLGDIDLMSDYKRDMRFANLTEVRANQRLE